MADLWVDSGARLVVPGPPTGTTTDQASAVIGQRTIKARVTALPGGDQTAFSLNGAYNNTLWARDDTGQPGWRLTFDAGTDRTYLVHATAAGVEANAFFVEGAGRLNVPGPGTSEATDQASIVLGTRTQKGRLFALPAVDYTALSLNCRYDGSAFIRDDATKSAWRAVLRTDTDAFQVLYLSSAGAASTPLALDSSGNLTLAGTVLAQAGTIAVQNAPASPVKTRVLTHGNFNTYLSNNLDVTVPAQDDTARPSWVINLGSTGNDVVSIRRAPPGSTTMTTLLSLNSSGGVAVTGNDVGVISLVGASGANPATYYCRSSRGTVAAPTAVQANDIIGGMQFGGYGTGYADTVLVRGVAVETWTATAHGSSFIVYTTATGAASPSPSLVFDGSGNLTISGPVGQKSSGTTWANPSDRRLKDDIESYLTGLDAILGLMPRTFVYNGKGGSQKGMRGYSFIADEVAAVLPEMVSVTRAKLDPDDADDTDIQTLDTSNLTLVLVNAVKELADRVTALEAR